MTDSDQGWIKTTCAYCGVGCGVEARATRSGLLEIRGDKSHPANYGKLCTKGIALGDTVIHDGRLLTPTWQDRSTSEKKQLNWDQATAMVAEKFSQTIEEHGPDSVAFYVSGQLLTEDYYVANKLMKGFIGSANIDSNSRLCMASSVVGHKRAFGSDTVPVCYEDLECAELVILTGSNLAWCHPVLFQRLRVAKEKNPGLQVVVIDPRQTASCEIADTHLAINSGADVALFNHLLSYLHQNDHVDESFIQTHTNNFNSAIESAEQQTMVEEITGLSEDELSSFCELFASCKRVLTVYSQGVNQSSSGSDKVNSIINCHLATGRIGQPGMGPFSVTGQPNAMGGREVGALANTMAAHLEFDNSYHHQLLSNFWQTERLATRPGLKAIDLFDAMEKGEIKTVWIMATNPMVSLPDSQKIERALDKCPFVVVSDCIADTETTRMADLLLPAQGWSEKSGTVTNSERRISRQRRILPSPGMAKPDWWIISQVAQKMGYRDAFDYLHEGEIFKEHAELTAFENTDKQRDLNLVGLTQLDERGYGALLPQQWPVQDLQTEPVNQRLFADNRFFTQDGRANFIAVTYDTPKLSVSDEYPLLLNSGRTRDHWHTMSRTGLSARLAEHTPEPYVLVHPDTAHRYQLIDGQLAKVANGQGECLVRVEVTRAQRIGEMFIPIHWNNTTAGQSKPCVLIGNATDLLSGQPEFKHTPVAASPFPVQTEAVVISRKVQSLENLEYWSRQKVEDGYLYRIGSSLPLDQLANALSTQLEIPAGQQYQFDSQGQSSRSTWVVQDKTQLLVAVQESFDVSEIAQLTDYFCSDGEDLSVLYGVEPGNVEI